MNPLRDYSDYLLDIRDAAQKAIEFIAGLDAEAFAADEKSAFAVIRGATRQPNLDYRRRVLVTGHDGQRHLC